MLDLLCIAKRLGCYSILTYTSYIVSVTLWMNQAILLPVHVLEFLIEDFWGKILMEKITKIIVFLVKHWWSLSCLFSLPFFFLFLFLYFLPHVLVSLSPSSSFFSFFSSFLALLKVQMDSKFYWKNCPHTTTKYQLQQWKQMKELKTGNK